MVLRESEYELKRGYFNYSQFRYVKGGVQVRLFLFFFVNLTERKSE